jgi:hypothetical protein
MGSDRDLADLYEALEGPNLRFFCKSTLMAPETLVTQPEIDSEIFFV